MKSLHNLVLNYYKNRDESHGYQHVYSVYNIAKDIAKNLNINDKKQLLIIKCAALFHDAWDHKYITSDINIKSNLRNDLKRLDLDNTELDNTKLDNKDIDNIFTIIDNVSFSKEYNLNKSGILLDLPKIDNINIFRDIISDSDKIESLGLNGINRIFIYEYNLDKTQNIEYYISAIKKVYYNRVKIIIDQNYIKTEQGKHISKPLIDEMNNIINNENVLFDITKILYNKYSK